MTLVTRGADILIITGGYVELMATAKQRITVVVCAEVVVGAIKQRPILTQTVLALVTERTGIAVVTLHAIGSVETPIVTIAAIISTGISVVTTDGHTRHTFALHTCVTNGARVARDTRVPLVVGSRFANSGPWITDRFQTDGLRSFGSGTCNC